jgi:hypothetical protein
MYSKIDFSQSSLEVPIKFMTVALFFLKSLELLDDIEFKLDGNP